ncbi:hypothetical protein ACTHO5_26175 [Cytobacillus praedii]
MSNSHKFVPIEHPSGLIDAAEAEVATNNAAANRMIPNFFFTLITS